jgi:hypothetical protein
MKILAIALESDTHRILTYQKIQPKVPANSLYGCLLLKQSLRVEAFYEGPSKSPLERTPVRRLVVRLSEVGVEDLRERPPCLCEGDDL